MATPYTGRPYVVGSWKNPIEGGGGDLYISRPAVKVTVKEASSLVENRGNWAGLWANAHLRCVVAVTLERYLHGEPRSVIAASNGITGRCLGRLWGALFGGPAQYAKSLTPADMDLGSTEARVARMDAVWKGNAHCGSRSMATPHD